MLKETTNKIVCPASLVLVSAVTISCSALLDFDEVAFQEGGPTDGAVTDGSGAGGSGDAASGGSGGTAGSAGTTGTGGATGGAAGQDAGTGGVSGSGGTGGAPGTGGSAGTGPPDPCAAVTCASGEYCDPTDQQCKCLPGWTPNGSACEMELPGDPSTHTQTQVCDKWAWGHTLTDPSPWTAGPVECDPGTLTRDGINDAVRRINMFRWLVGLGPTYDSPALNERNRWCAVLASWNPPNSLTCALYPTCCPDGCSSHSPPADAKCYTPEGASGTGSSNLSWGASVADAIDNFIRDQGTPSLGHRRWLFNPPLGPVGIGYYAGGGGYGRAQCTAVFGGGGTGPSPAWLAFPPPGPSPSSIFAWTWSFHATVSIGAATVTVTQVSNNTDLPVTTSTPMGPAWGTIAIQRSGWTAQVGESYRVTVDNISGGPITYEVTPVPCN